MQAPDRWFFHRVIKPAFRRLLLGIVGEIRKRYRLFDPENAPDPRAKALFKATEEAFKEIRRDQIPADLEVLRALRDILVFYVSYEPHYGIFIYDLILKHAKRYPEIFKPHPRVKQYAIRKK